MPSTRKDLKATRQKRLTKPSLDASDNDSKIEEFTEEQHKLRAMIPALTPAHGPESTASAILGSLALGQQKPNSHTRKKSDGHVNRPPNAFIVFRRAQVQHMPANITQHQQRISNLTASFWRVLTAFEQKAWYNLADDIKTLHAILFPEYNFSPRNADSDAPKKPAVPHAGLTAERYDFAWNEAQVLIQKHSIMVDYVIDGPAPSGKLVRPKAPRKGQGTRAKERRQLEAAQRAAAEDVISESMFTNTFNDARFDDPHFYAVDEEPLTNTSVEGEGIQWSSEFTLDGSVSSRSSPSWSENIGPLDVPYNENHFEQSPYMSDQPIAPVDNLLMQFHSLDPFTATQPQDDGLFNRCVQYEDTNNYITGTHYMIPPVETPKHDMTFLLTDPYASLTTPPNHVQSTFYDARPPMTVNVSWGYQGLDLTNTYTDTYTSEQAYNWQA